MAIKQENQQNFHEAEHLCDCECRVCVCVFVRELLPPDESLRYLLVAQGTPGVIVLSVSRTDHFQGPKSPDHGNSSDDGQVHQNLGKQKC